MAGGISYKQVRDEDAWVVCGACFHKYRAANRHCPECHLYAGRTDRNPGGIGSGTGTPVRIVDERR